MKSVTGRWILGCTKQRYTCIKILTLHVESPASIALILNAAHGM